MNNVSQQIETTALVNLPPEQRAAIVLDSGKAETQLREMLVKSADIVEVKDKDGRTMAHNAAMQLKVARVSIEKTGKAAREDAQAFSKAVIAEEKRLTAIILPEEDRLLGLRNEYDRKIEAERQERERKERERVSAIQGRINAIKHLPIDSANDVADQLQQTLDELTSLIIGDDFAEFKDEAMNAKLAAINSLTLMAGAAKASEAEAARLKAERKRLDEMRAEEEDRINAERAKLAEERKQEEARQREEREKLEAQRTELEALRAQIAAMQAQAESNQQKENPASEECIPVAAQENAEDCSVVHGTIRRIFMAHGFTAKEGQTDLKPYVYEAAMALLREFSPPTVSADGLVAAEREACAKVCDALRDCEEITDGYRAGAGWCDEAIRARGYA